MDSLSFVVALLVSWLTLNGLIEKTGVFTSVVVATFAGFLFGILAHLGS